MHGVDRKPRPVVDRHAQRARDPDHDADRQQHERDRAGAARQVPVGARSERGVRLRGSRRRLQGARDREILACLGPPAQVKRGPVVADEATREPQRGKPRGRAAAAHDRGGARDVCVQTTGGRHARRSPAAVCRQAGRWVQQMVNDGSARTTPPARRGARRRQTAGLQRDGLTRSVGVGPVVVGHTYPPPLGRRWTGGGDVAAEADEHSAAGGPRSISRRVVGGERLRGRAEVEGRARPDRSPFRPRRRL